MFKPIHIGRFEIWENSPCFVIAEAGVNHNGDMALAHHLIDAASACKADCVKFQLFVTEEIVTASLSKARYQIKNTGDSSSQFEMLKKLELTLEQVSSLKQHCDDKGILFLCTPYDSPSVDNLIKIGSAALKIASTDLTNTPFLSYAANKGVPLIVSTGMSTIGEIESAYQAISEKASANSLVLLHCTSEYPAPVEEVNLRVIRTMRETFQCPTGFSDHTEGTDVSVWAVIAGANVIEKHFTLDCNLPGPDHKASLNPENFSLLVNKIRSAEISLGDGIKRITPSETTNKRFMQKSLVARRDIPSGKILCEEDLAVKRPATGISPNMREQIIGMRSACPIKADETLQNFHIDWRSKL